MSKQEVALPGGRQLVVRGIPLERLAGLQDPDEVYDVEAQALIDAGIPENTRATFLRYAKLIVRWGGETGREVLPMTPASCIRLMADLERRPGRYNTPDPDGKMPKFRPLAPETVRMYLKVISRAHRLALRPERERGGQVFVGYESPSKHPDVQTAFRGYVRRWLAAGHRPDSASEISPAEIGKMIATLDLRANRDLRDAAVLAVGYDGGFRASELAAINVVDLGFVTNMQGKKILVVHVPMSKTDQSGRGDDVHLRMHPEKYASTCPYRLTQAWLERCRAVGLVEGPLFRNLAGGGPPPADGRPRKSKILAERMPKSAVTAAINRTAAAADLVVGDMPARQQRHIVPHSLRAGSATAAAERGADTAELADHFRWAPGSTVPNIYVKRGRMRGERNPASRIWTDDEDEGD